MHLSVCLSTVTAFNTVGKYVEHKFCPFKIHVFVINYGVYDSFLV